MRKYETVFISDPDLQDQTRAELFDKVRNIISRENGILLDFDEWGSKKLAYEIKKKLRGYYVCLTYGGTGDLVKELERNFRLSDDIMKFMTLLLSENETAETLEKQAAEIAESKTADAEPAEETPAEETPAAKEPVKEEAASEEPTEAADAEEKAAEAPAEETAEAVETKE
ncbi:MAG: 30S ribosomal protein S6 [Desulfobacter sp.]